VNQGVKKLKRLLIAVVFSSAVALAQQQPKSVAKASEARPLTTSAQDAMKLSNNWKNGASPVSVDSVGRVKYVYGVDMPTIVCAPVRICALELEPGERVTGDVQIGDTVSWNYLLLYYGSNAAAQTAVVVLRPTPAAMDTNLLLTTDRRVYYLRLVGHGSDYMSRVSFTYPEDSAARWQSEIKAHEAPPPITAPIAPAVNRDDVEREVIANLSFDYNVTGGKKTPCIKPSRVYDDGAHTVIVMPACVNSRELPVLVVHADGKDIVTNYRYANGKFVVDRLFDQAKLQAGGSKKAAKDAVRIERGKADANEHKSE
jgi:P-type conjugative transfer protein TrbG